MKKCLNFIFDGYKNVSSLFGNGKISGNGMKIKKLRRRVKDQKDSMVDIWGLSLGVSVSNFKFL